MKGPGREVTTRFKQAFSWFGPIAARAGVSCSEIERLAADFAHNCPAIRSAMLQQRDCPKVLVAYSMTLRRTHSAFFALLTPRKNREAAVPFFQALSRPGNGGRAVNGLYLLRYGYVWKEQMHLLDTL